jgi:hypothetical protein
MEKALVQYCIGAYTYGTMRTIAYAPPLKKDEYVTERVGCILVYALSSPFMAPGYLFKDIRNLEHIARKMPGHIDRNPWTHRPESMVLETTTS